jgi:hypothetical protein
MAAVVERACQSFPKPFRTPALHIYMHIRSRAQSETLFRSKYASGALYNIDASIANLGPLLHEELHIENLAPSHSWTS